MGLMSITIPAPQPIPDAAAEVVYWSRQVAAGTLITEVADWLGIDIDLVWQVLCAVPDDQLGLLDSPQGWSALAGYVAVELGVVAPAYMPVVH